MGALLALGSAVCYGVADFAGGLLSRRASFASVALFGQAGGLLVMLLAAPLVPTAALTVHDLGWGALSGVGTGLGMAFLYRGLAAGDMSVVVPISAVGGVALPVLVGVAVLGDRPTIPSWLGVAAAVPALWLVSRNGLGGDSLVTRAAVDGLIASVGIALQYLALAQAGADAGIWPVAAGRVTAIITILPMVRPANVRIRLPLPLGLAAAATGAVAALALVLYLLATRQELLTIAVVLSSLYPVIPVVLGLTVLHERVNGRQTVGLVGAAAAVVLLTTS